FSSRRRHTRFSRDWSSDVCSSDLPIPGLEDLLARAKAKGVFGTKERSVIKANNAAGIAAVLDQQFELARKVLATGLVPIIEPERSEERRVGKECRAGWEQERAETR